MIDYWKGKVAIVDVLEGRPVGRSVTGLRRAVQRMFEKGKPKADAILLKNYEKLVDKAKVLGPNMIMSVPTDEMMGAIEMLQKEHVVLPESTQYALVLRQAQVYIELGQYRDLLRVISFWGRETRRIDASNPKLASLESHSSKKISTWQRLFFQDLLLPLVYAGQAEAMNVINLCKLCLEVMESVDMVIVDGPSAAALDESSCICKCLQALLSPDAPASAEVGPA